MFEVAPTLTLARKPSGRCLVVPPIPSAVLQSVAGKIVEKEAKLAAVKSSATQQLDDAMFKLQSQHDDLTARIAKAGGPGTAAGTKLAERALLIQEERTRIGKIATRALKGKIKKSPLTEMRKTKAIMAKKRKALKVRQLREAKAAKKVGKAVVRKPTLTVKKKVSKAVKVKVKKPTVTKPVPTAPGVSSMRDELEVSISKHERALKSLADSGLEWGDPPFERRSRIVDQLKKLRGKASKGKLPSLKKSVGELEKKMAVEKAKSLKSNPFQLNQNEREAVTAWIAGPTVNPIRAIQRKESLAKFTAREIKEARWHIESLDSAYRKMGKYSGKVHRGMLVKEKDVKKWAKKGKKVEIQAWTSSSARKDIAEEFTEWWGPAQSGDARVVMSVDVKDIGVDIRKMGSAPYQKEVLLPPGFEWEITDVKKVIQKNVGSWEAIEPELLKRLKLKGQEVTETYIKQHKERNYYYHVTGKAVKTKAA